MSLTPGDLDLLSDVARYRVLTSGQAARRRGRSNQTVRRAFRRRLRPGGYIVNLERRPTEEVAVALGTGGLEWLATESGCSVEQLPFPKKLARERTYMFRHTLLVTDIRIAFDLAAEQPTAPLRISRSIPEWEYTPGASPKAPHHQRFLLSERFDGPNGPCVHRPDCLFLIHAERRSQHPVATFVEADRRTEAMGRIRRKLEAYWRYWRDRRFVEAFSAVGMRVLFVIGDSGGDMRIRSMLDELRQFSAESGAEAAFSRCFRFTRSQDLNERSVFEAPVWLDAEGTRRPFYIAPTEGVSP